MDFTEKRQTYLDAAVRLLATEGGFHPVGMVMPSLAGYAALAPHVLVRQLPDGYWQMLMLAECDAPDAFAAWRDRVVDHARSCPQLTASLKLRISCVGIGDGPLSRALKRSLLAPQRFQDSHVVVRSFWVSLAMRRMFTWKSPWSLAPSFEINPTDPDENLLVEILRRDHYLKSAGKPPVTEEFHRRTMQKVASFRAGLKGPRILVRTVIAVNVAVWLGLYFTGGAQSVERLILAGAKVNGLISAGQTWRLVTPVFLHMGFLHLAFNAAGLYFFGEMVERVYGTAQFALVYFISGVAGSVASFYLGAPVMVGASGGVFGVVSALVMYGYLYRKRIPPRFGAMFGGGLVPLIVINLLFGLWYPQVVDNAAHVGGLCAGALVTLLLVPLADESEDSLGASLRRKAALVVGGVVLGSIVLAVVSLARFPMLYALDAEYLLPQRMPGDVVLRVPAAWIGSLPSKDTLIYESPAYPDSPARMDIRAFYLPPRPQVTEEGRGQTEMFIRYISRVLGVRLTEDQVREKTEALIASLASANQYLAELNLLSGELDRLRRLGYGGNLGGVDRDLLDAVRLQGRIDLRLEGRVEVGRGGRVLLQRHQVFLRLKKDILMGIGIEVSMEHAGDFAPAQQKILESLPPARTTEETERPPEVE